jgi:transposase
MLLRYRYRLEPTAMQRQALARAFDCARAVFNDRDVNAALNIKALGRRDLPNASGARGSPALGSAAGGEGGTSGG